MIKSKVVISFELSVPRNCYPAGITESEARKLEQLNFRGNTESLLEMLESTPYSVEVVVVDNG